MIGGRNKIDRKFFIHNSGFDFAIAVGDTQNAQEELVEIIKKQLLAAELMLDVLRNKEVRKYVANIELE